jgi:signal transduction histidine kinase
MKISIRLKIIVLSLVTSAVIATIGWLSYKSRLNLTDSEEWVARTNLVIDQSNNILLLAKDIETGSRGFAITADSVFLEPMQIAEKTIFASIAQLKQLTQDNPSQLRQIDSLSFYVRKKLEFSNQTLEARSKEGLAAAVAIISTKQGKYYTDRIREITNDIHLKENILLKQRQQTNEDSMESLNRSSIVLFILMGLFTALLIIMTSKYLVENKEKTKMIGELNQVNKELALQNDEKARRAAQMVIANRELAFLNDEKEKRAQELILANKELQSFAYVSSHDLQEPLRKIQTFVNRILEKENERLSDSGKDYFTRIQHSASRMQTLIEDLLTFSRVNTGERKFETTDLSKIIAELSSDFKEVIDKVGATIEINVEGHAHVIPFQFRQLMQNLIGNSLKFSNPKIPPRISISSKVSKGSEFLKQNPKLTVSLLEAEKNYSHIKVSDNGIGFESKFQEQVFEIFQKLHPKEEYHGTGIGLAIVKKIVENHNGIITATSDLDKGATFDIYIPEQDTKGSI